MIHEIYMIKKMLKHFSKNKDLKSHICTQRAQR